MVEEIGMHDELEAMYMAKADTIYELTVTLSDIEPAIWRRVQVPASLSLVDLHDVLQVLMGWTNSHLHMFTICGLVYMEPDEDGELEPDYDERDFRLCEVAGPKGSFEYEYDFGDSWRHEIIVERLLVPAAGQAYPFCLDGARACPPEDCGAVSGYARLLNALAHPDDDDDEAEQFRRWVDPKFHPETFDRESVNAALRKMRLRSRATSRRRTPPRRAVR